MIFKLQVQKWPQVLKAQTEEREPVIQGKVIDPELTFI